MYFDTIKIDNVIPNIVESMLPRFSDPKLGLLITVDYSFTEYSKDGEKEKHVRFGTYHLFQRPSNYTKVFSLNTLEDFEDISVPSKFDVIGKTLKWHWKSDHDSCWRSDGLKDIFRLCYDVRDIKNFHNTETSIHNSMGLFGGIEYVELEVPKYWDREKRDQEINIIRPLKSKEALKLVGE